MSLLHSASNVPSTSAVSPLLSDEERAAENNRLINKKNREEYGVGKRVRTSSGGREKKRRRRHRVVVVVDDDDDVDEDMPIREPEVVVRRYVRFVLSIQRKKDDTPMLHYLYHAVETVEERDALGYLVVALFRRRHWELVPIEYKDHTIKADDVPSQLRWVAGILGCWRSKFATDRGEVLLRFEDPGHLFGEAAVTEIATAKPITKAQLHRKISFVGQTRDAIVASVLSCLGSSSS